MRPYLIAAALLLAPSLHAQVLEIYGTFSPTHASNVAAGSITSGGAFTAQYASFWVPAVGGGVTLNFLPLGPLKLGFDLRGSTKPGFNGVDTALVGLKLGVKAPLLPIRPYVQLSGGYVATRTNLLSTYANGQAVGGTTDDKYAAFEGIAGVDYHLLPFVNLRVVELGVGKGYQGSLSFGNVANSGKNLTLFTINTGIVVHF